MLNFEGIFLDTTKIVAIGNVYSKKTGSMTCDWAFAFDIHLTGNTVSFILPQPKDFGYSSFKVEEYKAKAEQLRLDLVTIKLGIDNLNK